MNVTPVNTTKQNAYVNSAKTGAVRTASIFAITNTAMDILSPERAKAAVAKAGGTGKYLKKYALFTCLSAAVGAAVYAGLEALNIRSHKKVKNETQN